MKEKLWTKDYILDIVNNLLVAVVFYIFIVYTTTMAIGDFSASVSEAGLAASFFIVGALVLRIFTGRHMDAIGRKKMLVASSVLYAASTLSFHFIDSLTVLYLVRFFQGTAYGVSSTVMATAVAVSVPAKRRGEGIGFFTLSLTLASAIGPFLGITLPQINEMYLLYLCDLLVLAIIICSVSLQVPESAEKENTAGKPFSLSNFIELSVLPIASISLLCTIGYSAVMTYIGAYSASMGLFLGGSLFYVAYSAACLIFRPLSGIALDRYGNNFVMLPILVMTILGFAVISIADTNAALLIGAVCLGVGYGTIPSACSAIAVQKLDKNRFGLATATVFMSLDIGNGTGPHLLGMIEPVYGFSAVYAAGAMASACALFAYFVTMYKRKQKCVQ